MTNKQNMQTTYLEILTFLLSLALIFVLPCALIFTCQQEAQWAMSEQDRIKELKRYEILDSPKDGAFDDVCAIASKCFDVPISIVSLVDEDRIWFKAATGLDGVDEIDRGPGLCASAIMKEGVYVARDLKLDPNSLANPLVAKENGFRFYAAAPLKSAKGYNLGTMCIIDFQPREFSDEQQALLERLGRQVMSHMEQRVASREVASLAKKIEDQNRELTHLASHDALTGLKNRGAIVRELERAHEEFDCDSLALMIIDVDNFKAINDTKGHPAGDQVLVEVARRLRSMTRANEMVGRFGGEEFIILVRCIEPDAATGLAERIRKCVSITPITLEEGTSLTVTVSVGMCVGDAGADPDDVLRIADDALYFAKNSGRNLSAYSVMTHVRAGGPVQSTSPQIIGNSRPPFSAGLMSA